MCLGVPGKIVSLENGDSIARTGRVSFGGVIKQVNLALVRDACIGDYVIVHAGFGISVLDEREANKTLEYLRQLESSRDSGNDW